MSLLGPLLARANGWGARVAGLVGGGQALGIVAVSLLVARRGPSRRAVRAAGRGLCGAAAGIAGLAAAPDAVAAVVAGVCVGLGAGVFTSHLGPLVLTGAPDSHLARVQAVLTLVQSIALVASNNALGALADAAGPAAALTACAVLTGAAGVLGSMSFPLAAPIEKR